MAAYLIEHPPVRDQYRNPRREDPSGVIEVHSAENTPDFVAFDGGAEAVANFIRTRTTPGSYHDLADSDSLLDIVPYEFEAYHDATGMNPHALSVSIATRADVWALAPQKWKDGATENAARGAARQARWIKAKTGIVVPARRITADEARRKIPGFVSHAQMDPTRRSDPGKDFPWSQFLARFAELTGNATTPTAPPPEADLMYKIVWIKGSGKPGAAYRVLFAKGRDGRDFPVEAHDIDAEDLDGWRKRLEEVPSSKPLPPSPYIRIIDGPYANV